MKKYPEPLKVVVDTNILVSSLICERGNPALLINAFKNNEFELISSSQLMDEFIEVIERPHIRQKYKLTDEEIKDFIEYIYRKATMVPGIYKVKRSEDPKDNMFLACALEGRADYLITGDPHLGNLKYYHGIQIVTVKQILELLKRTGM